MRPLTPAETAVIASVLGGAPVSDRERMRRSGLPSRTYEAAHRRAQQQGWLVERYVPNPVLFGRPRMTLAVARPAAGTMDDCAAWWTSLREAALIWRGAQSLFGIFFDGDSPTVTPIRRDLDSRGRYASTFLLEVDLSMPQVPVYFDFEAAWARVCNQHGTQAYPRALPTRAPRGPLTSPNVPPRWRSMIQQIVRYPLAASAPGSAQGPFYRLGRRGVIRRALGTGWIDQRAFLDPTRMPCVGSWRLEQVAYLCGRLLPGVPPESLLVDLVDRLEVCPFLFASDGRQVLVGTLSPAPPRVEKDRGRRPSLRAGLRSSLDSVEVVREPVADLTAPTNHCYDMITT